MNPREIDCLYPVLTQRGRLIGWLKSRKKGLYPQTRLDDERHSEALLVNAKAGDEVYCTDNDRYIVVEIKEDTDTEEGWVIIVRSKKIGDQPDINRIIYLDHRKLGKRFG